MSAKTERLVNLAVALLAASRPLSFAELRDRMGEWQGGDPESQRRKFERDKDELRRLGVPIETVTTSSLSGDAAYVVDRDRYELREVDLTAEQMTVLAVAFRLVDGGADRLAFSKVAALAPDPDGDAAQTPAGIRIEAGDLDAVAPLGEAVVDHRVVRFRYRRASGEVTAREVEPTALLQQGGRWYLRGHDRMRDARRTFRADRIVGSVDVTEEQAEARRVGDDFTTELFPVEDEVQLSVAVRDGPAWRLEQRRATARAARTQALGSAPHEVLLAPAELAAEVEAGLRAVLATHEAAS